MNTSKKPTISYHKKTVERYEEIKIAGANVS